MVDQIPPRYMCDHSDKEPLEQMPGKMWLKQNTSYPKQSKSQRQQNFTSSSQSANFKSVPK